MKILLALFFSILLFTNTAMAVEEINLKTESEFIPTYENRFSLNLGMNPSLTKSSDVANFAFSYEKKLDTFWLDTNLLVTSGVFNKISTNNSPATGLTDNQLLDTKSSMITLGAGVARTSQYTKTLIPFNNLYEVIAADITYNVFKEPTSGKSFSGPGILAKFTLNNKFSEYFSAGAQLTYTLATVKRASETDAETSSAKSLTSSYLTVGFDISFYL